MMEVKMKEKKITNESKRQEKIFKITKVKEKKVNKRVTSSRF